MFASKKDKLGFIQLLHATLVEIKDLWFAQTLPAFKSRLKTQFLLCFYVYIFLLHSKIVSSI